MSNLSRKERESIYHMQAEVCRLLGHPKRLRILDLLAEGEKSSGELLRILGISKVNLSQHLAVMRRAGLIESRQQGREAYHKLAFSEIRDACRLTRDVLAARLNQNTRLAKGLSSAQRETERDSSKTGA
jgi:DNA-binding transcriptional ArsR family regulator